MKYFFLGFAVIASLISCSKKSKLVDISYVDSLVSHYSLSQQVKDNTDEIKFWKARINPAKPGYISEGKYAAALISRFHQFGDILDIREGESVYRKINRDYNNSLPGPFVALASSAMLQHHFIQADTLLDQAKKIGINDFTTNTLSFDVYFEEGKLPLAAFYLNRLKKAKDYSYYFRRSKYDHFKGDIDSAINGMQKAADLMTTAPVLQGIALSNEGDLFIHSGKLENAAGIYKKCIQLNNIDFHSILGLGWIALINDKNDTLAEKLFKFVLSKNKLPDPLFKLYQMAQTRADRSLEKKYAEEFVNRATDSIYGKMYNKYVIEIYTGILHDPNKAVELAKNELNNRVTPQVYAWYAYTLFENNKKEEAYRVFQKYISGQPLEGLELYYMGVMMKGLGKGYNAHEFFKAADKNKYDLSPDMAKVLAQNLEE